MSKLSYVMGMLTLAGAGAAQASTTVTFNFPVNDYSTFSGPAAFTETPITVAGASAPQFYFGTIYQPCTGTCTPGDNASLYTALNFLQTARETSLGTGVLGSQDPYYGTAYSNSGFGVKSLTPGLPSAGETFTKSTLIGTGLYVSPKTATPSGGVPTDISNINEISWLVTYSVPGSTGDLYSHVTFDVNGHNYVGTFHIDNPGNVVSLDYVPEPEAWTLLIAGTAMVGGAARLRRRKVALAA